MSEEGSKPVEVKKEEDVLLVEETKKEKEEVVLAEEVKEEDGKEKVPVVSEAKKEEEEDLGYDDILDHPVIELTDEIIEKIEKHEWKVRVKRGPNYVEWKTPFMCIWGEWTPKLDIDSGMTLVHNFLNFTESQPEKDFVGWRPKKSEEEGGKYDVYKFLSYREGGELCKQVGYGLRELGLHPKMSVGVFSSNCPEWTLAEYGSYTQNMVLVPLYPTCGPGTINYIVSHTDISVVFCHGNVVGRLLKEVSQKIDDQQTPLKTIIVIGEHDRDKLQIPELDADSKRSVETNGIRLMTFFELLDLGAAHPIPLELPTPDDLWSIIYTSGSEGVPKGVETTHRAITSSLNVFSELPNFRESIANWTYYSYLPLAHGFERQSNACLIKSGATIGYSSGLSNLIEDLGLLRPHFIVGVPRVWKRIYEKVTQAVNSESFLRRLAFNTALNRKIAALQSGTVPWRMWDSLVLHNVADKLGGRLRFVISGGAAADPMLSTWFKAVFNVGFYQGYGMTECVAAVCNQHAGCDRDGSAVGPPMPAATLRLEDVPDMDYLTSNDPPRGEICVAGDMVMRGYHKDPKLTKEVIIDGFYHSGDIGQLNPDGSVTIVDRKKNLFKLAQGEYIAIEYVETVYGRSDIVKQIWVWGDPLDNFLIAVVVPDLDILLPLIRARLEQNGAPVPPKDASPESLCALPEAREIVLEKLSVAAASAKLLSYQQVKTLLVEPKPWTIEDDLLTPTLKTRRVQLRKKYENAINALREEYKEAHKDDFLKKN